MLRAPGSRCGLRAERRADEAAAAVRESPAGAARGRGLRIVTCGFRILCSRWSQGAAPLGRGREPVQRGLQGQC